MLLEFSFILLLTIVLAMLNILVPNIICIILGGLLGLAISLRVTSCSKFGELQVKYCNALTIVIIILIITSIMLVFGNQISSVSNNTLATNIATILNYLFSFGFSINLSLLISINYLLYRIYDTNNITELNEKKERLEYLIWSEGLIFIVSIAFTALSIFLFRTLSIELSAKHFDFIKFFLLTVSTIITVFVCQNKFADDKYK